MDAATDAPQDRMADEGATPTRRECHQGCSKATCFGRCGLNYQHTGDHQCDTCGNQW